MKVYSLFRPDNATSQDNMRVAVPEYKGRVAPVFDCCGSVLIIMLGRDGQEVIADEDWKRLPRLTRANRLKDLTVELLICGGISCCMEEQIRRLGVQIIPWISGTVPEVLAALLDGTLTDPRYVMPGRLRRGRGDHPNGNGTPHGRGPGNMWKRSLLCRDLMERDPTEPDRGQEEAEAVVASINTVWEP